jgi:hypothetical protein
VQTPLDRRQKKHTVRRSSAQNCSSRRENLLRPTGADRTLKQTRCRLELENKGAANEAALLQAFMVLPLRRRSRTES